MKLRPISLTIGGRSLTFTALGARFIIVTLAVGVAAVNSGSNLLYLIVAMMLSMMLLSGILSEQALRRLLVDRKVPPEIYAEDPFPLRFRLRNLKRFSPSYALSVAQKNKEGTKTAGAFVLRLGPGEEGGAQALQTLTKRGRWITSGYEIATRYPFGLFRKALLVDREESCTVYPRIRPLPGALSEGLSRSLLGETQSSRKGMGEDIRSLREYVFPEDSRGIHWKASARTGRLLSKEYDARERQAVAVIIDNLVPEDPPEDYDERFEEAVSLAASFIWHIIFELSRPAFLVSRSGRHPAFRPNGRQSTDMGQDGEGYIALMEELSELMPVNNQDAGGPEASSQRPVYRLNRHISGIFTEWPSVLILPTASCGWAAFASAAGVTCEAGKK